MPLPWPAPASTSTRWPARVNSRDPTGIRATRYSSLLISFGTPIIMNLPLQRNAAYSGENAVSDQEQPNAAALDHRDLRALLDQLAVVAHLSRSAAGVDFRRARALLCGTCR